MLRALIRELKGTGIRRIDTAVYKRNRHALGFYKKMRFRELKEERFSCAMTTKSAQHLFF